MSVIPDSLVQSGVLGVILAWFMFRVEKIVQSNTEAILKLTLVVGECPKKNVQQS